MWVVPPWQVGVHIRAAGREIVPLMLPVWLSTVKTFQSEMLCNKPIFLIPGVGWGLSRVSWPSFVCPRCLLCVLDAFYVQSWHPGSGEHSNTFCPYFMYLFDMCTVIPGLLLLLWQAGFHSVSCILALLLLWALHEKLSCLPVSSDNLCLSLLLMVPFQAFQGKMHCTLIPLWYWLTWMPLQGTVGGWLSKGY